MPEPEKKNGRSRGRPGFMEGVTPREEKKLRKQVEMMAAFGNTEDQMAQILGCTPPTLRKHFKRELEVGFLKANNAVAQNLFRQATKDDPRAFNSMQLWLKLRGGWHEYMLPVPKPGATTTTKPTEEKPIASPAMGKKEREAEEAKHPNVETDIGALMARRAQGPLN